MGNLKGYELLIIALLLVLLFVSKRLPDAARSIGRSLRIFKSETRGLVDGEAPSAPTAPSAGAGTSTPEATSPADPSSATKTPPPPQA